MAITIDDFSKIWASTSPLTPYEFSENNYKEGWNFVGATPPSRQMWDFSQKNNDEKMQYLADNYLPLSGGTMTGTITTSSGNMLNGSGTDEQYWISGGTPYDKGAWLMLNGVDRTLDAGAFQLVARNASGNYKGFQGKPDGSLSWGGVSLTDGTFLTTRIVSTDINPTGGSNVTAPTVSGYQFVCWVMSASQGNIIPSYIGNATSNPGRIWYSGSAVGVYFDCTALYVRKW